eukprot:1476699-Amphidinium_carterae.1
MHSGMLKRQLLHHLTGAAMLDLIVGSFCAQPVGREPQWIHPCGIGVSSLPGSGVTVLTSRILNCV